MKVLLSICSLLTDPNPEDPLVPEIAQVFQVAEILNIAFTFFSYHVLFISRRNWSPLEKSMIRQQPNGLENTQFSQHLIYATDGNYLLH